MTRIAIIGAGVIGCAAALELARRGADPIVVDRLGEAGHGSTSASCGIVRRFYSTPTMTAMAHEGAGIWADWSGHLGVEDESGMARFERPGMLFIPHEAGGEVKRIMAHMLALGVAVEFLTREEVAGRFPFLDTSSHSPVRRPEDPDFLAATNRRIPGAVLERDAGYVVSPILAAHNLRVAAEKHGAVFKLGRGAAAIRRKDNGRFRIDLDGGGKVEADAVLNAGGPHSSAVNRMAGVALPIAVRPLRREVHAVPNPAHSDGAGPAVPVVGDLDSGVYFRPEEGGRELVVGSLEPPCDTLEWVADADDWNTSVTVAGYERQVMRLMKRFPGVRLGRRRGIAALYDVTVPDWNPVIDKTDLLGFYVAIGTSGSSFKTAPVIGIVVAELILACENGRDHDADPVTVALPRTGFDVDVAFFSRLRAGHTTSASVLG